VRSPTATASVRGTVFEFDTVNLRVAEGTVSFSGADRTAVYVAAGQSSSPDPVSGRAAAPVETAAALTPPPPAGAEDSAAPASTAIPPVIVPPAPPPLPPAPPAPPPDLPNPPDPASDADVGIGVHWPD
jgi:hypothetical protein